MIHLPRPQLRSAGKARRTHVAVITGLVTALALLGACGASSTTTGQTTTGATTAPTSSAATVAPTTALSPSGGGLGPERVPIPNGPALGPVNSAVYGQPIDGIKCETSEQVVYHIHAHLAVFVNGQPRQVPPGIGIGPPLQIQTVSSGAFVVGGSCFYWLHTHASDGVIHIESPTQRQYTLGQFFDVWGQTLAAGQVGPAVGTVTAYVDGRVVTGDPRSITLGMHTLVQLDVGTVVPPQTIAWSPSGL